MTITVRDIMHSVTLVDGGLSVAEIAKIMMTAITVPRGEIGSVLIAKEGSLLGGKTSCSSSECDLHDIAGILTERDILRKVVAKGIDPSKLKGCDIMSKPLVTVPSRTTLDVASRVMTEKGIRRLLVTEGNKIIGIVTTRDVTRALNAVLHGEEQALRRFSIRF
jgi:CBS domain-containing protein